MFTKIHSVSQEEVFLELLKLGIFLEEYNSAYLKSYNWRSRFFSLINQQGHATQSQVVAFYDWSSKNFISISEIKSNLILVKAWITYKQTSLGNCK